MSVESRAIEAACNFFKANGWTVQNVSRASGEYAGCDLAIKKGDEQLKVEVKGSEKEYFGIPDLYGSEVDELGKLVADLLCVIYLPPDGTEKLAIIRREDFPSDAMIRKIGYRIKPEYKNLKHIKNYLLNMSEPWAHKE